MLHLVAASNHDPEPSSGHIFNVFLDAAAAMSKGLPYREYKGYVWGILR